MTETEFRARMSESQSYGDDDYHHGYQRGLRRHYHGERFGTAEEHTRWLTLGTDGDPREAMGRGYRDGLAGQRPTP